MIRKGRGRSTGSPKERNGSHGVVRILAWKVNHGRSPLRALHVFFPSKNGVIWRDLFEKEGEEGQRTG